MLHMFAPAFFVLLLCSGIVVATDLSCAVGNTTTPPLYPQLQVNTNPAVNASCGLFVPWLSLSALNIGVDDYGMPRDAIVGIVSSTTLLIGNLSIGLWSTEPASMLSANQTTTAVNFTLIGYMSRVTCRTLGYNTNTRFYNCTLRPLLSYFNATVARLYANGTLAASFHLPLDTAEPASLSIAESTGQEGWTSWLPYRAACLSTWSQSSVPTTQVRPWTQRTFIYPTANGLLDTPLAETACADKHVVDTQPIGDIVIVTPNPSSSSPSPPPQTFLTIEPFDRLLLSIIVPSSVFVAAVVTTFVLRRRIIRRVQMWWRRRGYTQSYPFNDEGEESVADYQIVNGSRAMEMQPLTPVKSGGGGGDDPEMKVIDLQLADGGSQPSDVIMTAVVPTDDHRPPVKRVGRRLRDDNKPQLPSDGMVMVPNGDMLD